MKPITVVVLITALFCSSCSRTTTSHDTPATWPALGTIAIVPFENLGATPRAGIICADLVSAAWRAEDFIEPITEERVRSLLEPRLGEALTPQELGELLQADTLLVGKVTDYGYKQGLGQRPVVGMSLRLIEASSGRVLWNAARVDTGSANLFGEDGLGRLAIDVAEELLDTLPRGVADKP